MSLLASVVGIINGTYDIGGATIAPFCVAVFHLPVYTVAGTALLGMFFTLIVGVYFYSVLPATGGVSISPDWVLGFLFDIGGRACVSARGSRNSASAVHQAHAEDQIT